MKHFVRLLVVALLVSGFLIASSAFSRATFSELEAIETICEIVDPGEVKITKSGIMQVRGEIRRNRVVSTEDRVDGWNTLVVNYSLNLETFDGATQGTFMITPNAYPESSFQGTFHARIVGGMASGRAVAFGTGDLEGQQLTGTIVDFYSNPDDLGSCDDGGYTELPALTNFKKTLADGRILEPNSK